MGGVILSTGWYPVLYYCEYLEKIKQVVFNGDDQKMIERSRKTGFEKFSKGIYKIFVTFGSPQFIAKSTTRIAKFINQNITLKTLESSNNRIVVQYDGVDKRFRQFEVAAVGFDKGILEAAGAKNITAKIVKSCTDGGGVSRIEFHWE